MTHATPLLTRLLFPLTRSSFAQGCIGWVFAHMTFALPVQRLRETDTLIAFYHPRPAYPVHVLLVPRKAIPGLAELSPADQPFVADVFRVVQDLVAELQLESKGYRLIVNGGAYQDVKQLHFHLVSGSA